MRKRGQDSSAMASLLSQSPVRGEFLNSIYSKPSVEDVEVAKKMKEIG